MRTPDYDKRLTAEEAGRMLGVTAKTLCNWRSLEKGPPYHCDGRSIVYLRGEIEAYFRTHYRHVNPEAARRKAVESNLARLCAGMRRNRKNKAAQPAAE